jgi:hypothetical protein
MQRRQRYPWKQGLVSLPGGALSRVRHSAHSIPQLTLERFFVRQVPGFGLYKLYSLAAPFIFGRGSPKSTGAGQAQTGGRDAAAAEGDEGISKRQAKLKARAERGDKRVKSMERKR